MTKGLYVHAHKSGGPEYDSITFVHAVDKLTVPSMHLRLKLYIIMYAQCPWKSEITN